MFHCLEGARVSLRRAAVVTLLVTLATLTATADESTSEVPQIQALRIDGEITLDGRLDEAAWRQAPRAGGFTQRNPEPGAPITQATEFQVVYSSTTLYLGIRADNDDPAGLVAREMQRDGPLFRDDGLVVLLDTFHDHRNAYMFETNPLGARTDILVADEGAMTNIQWDGLWRVATSRGPDGWIAELAIPFSTLRFDPGLDTWGLQIRRLVRRNNEFAFWAPIGLDANLFRVSQFGHLTGLELPEPSLNLQVMPFVTGAYRDNVETGSDDESDAGLDIKWGLSRNFVLDLTYNTDFAEVEADALQVNLTRFSLFFPEKRDFFLENSGIFGFGPGAPQLGLFFSRRIGISPEGNPVPLEWGARLSGRAGGWSIGILDAQTGDATFTDADGEREEVPETNWGVVRVQRNLGERSTVGMMVTNIDTDDGSGDQRSYGLDANIKPTDRLTLSAFWARLEEDSRDEDSESSDGAWAAGAEAEWRSDLWSWELEVQEIGDDFAPDFGFVRRNGNRRYRGELDWQPRPASPAIRNYNIGADLDVYTRLDDSLESLNASLRFFGIELESANEIFLFAEHAEEDLDESFEIRPDIFIPQGRYEFDSLRGFWATNSSLPVSGFFGFRVGDFFDGERLSLEATGRWRPNRFLRLETSWFYNDIELPGGDFSTTILRQRVAVAFSPDMSLNGLVQYSDASETLGLNLRYRWTYRPGSDLFLVYNEGWDAPSLSDPRERERQVILKLSYLF